MTTQKALFADSRLSDLGTVTTGTQASASMSAARLLEDIPTTWWRTSDGTTTDTVDFLLDAATLSDLGGYDLFVICYWNASSTATWTVSTAASVAGLGSPAWTSASQPGWMMSAANMRGWPHPWVHAWLLLPAGSERTEAAVRITITDANPVLPDGYTGDPYMQAAKIFVAKAVRPTFHVAPGFEVVPAVTLARARSERHQIDAVADATAYLDWYSLAAWAGSLATARTVASGLSGQIFSQGVRGVWYSYDPDADDALKRSFWGRFADRIPLADSTPQHHRIGVTVQEWL